MEVDGEPRLLGQRPHRVPIGVGEIRLPETVGISTKKNALVPEIDTALDLCEARREVPERERHDRREALAAYRHPVAEKVVVRTHTREHELGFAERHELART